MERRNAAPGSERRGVVDAPAPHAVRSPANTRLVFLRRRTAQMDDRPACRLLTPLERKDVISSVLTFGLAVGLDMQPQPSQNTSRCTRPSGRLLTSNLAIGHDTQPW